LSNAEENSVIVCQSNNNSIALMGELSAEALKLKGVRGYITDAGCRDVTRIKSEIKLPVYCRYTTPKDVAGRWVVNEMGASIKIGEVNINTGDYIIADEDGIVIIPKNIIFKVINKAKEDLRSENKMRDAILNGIDPKEAYLKYKKF
jgi:regulator of RNase E activity RraA